MTPIARASRRDEQIDPSATLPLAIDPTPLLGRWQNTDPATTGITGVTIARAAGGVTVTVRPTGDTPYRATVDALYATSITGATATAFTAEHRGSGMATRLEANLSLGLLVIAASHTTGDSDLRTGYFAREFFFYAGE